jgi:hypothetical protein
LVGLVGLAVLAGVVLVGQSLLFRPGGENDAYLTEDAYTRAVRKAIKLRQSVTSVLAGVRDEASARAAVPRLQALQEEASALNSELKSVFEDNQTTEEAFQSANQGLNAEWNRAVAKMNDEAARANSRPQVRDALRESLAALSASIAQFELAREAETRNRQHAAVQELFGNASRQPQGQTKSARSTDARHRLAQRPNDTEYNALLDLVRRFFTMHRDDQHVFVRMAGATEEQQQGLASRLAEIAGTGVSTQCFPRFCAVAPAEDVSAFAQCIDFGVVKSVDQQARLIEVEVDSGWRFTEGAGNTLAGAPVAAQPPPTTAAAQPKSALKGDGPHGGMQRPLGDALTCEILVYKDSESVVVYLYNAADTTPAPIDNERIYLNYTREGVEQSSSLFPSPQPSDPKGRSSRFHCGFAQFTLESLQSRAKTFVHFEYRGKRLRAEL